MSDPQDRAVVAPRIEVTFDRPQRRYQAGDRLVVRYVIDECQGDRIHAVEQSVLWYTEGKGEEDLGVHMFRRVVDAAVLPPRAVGGEFSVHLPRSPLSYEGLIVKVRWCVRVRVFFEGAKDYVSEHVFEVGEVPPARVVQMRSP